MNRTTDHRLALALAVIPAGALACNTLLGGLKPDVLKTAEAIATEVKDSGLLGTAQAFATEQGAELVATAEAIATQGSFTLGEPPPDIPLVEGEKENFFGTPALVSYFTELEYQSVLEFYRKEMPANGWRAVEQGSIETEDAAVLNYEKPKRAAIVTISKSDGKTSVQILVQPK